MSGILKLVYSQERMPLNDYLVSLFDDDQDHIFQTELVKSVSDTNFQILKDIQTLFCPGGFECDVTYSSGTFYKGITPPAIKLDLIPQTPDTIQADVRALPLASNSMSNVMFDPPFLTGSKNKDAKLGIMKERFSVYPSIKDLWAMYQDALVELYRVLQPKGILIFKCQDTVESGTNYFTHVQVMNDAVAVGFSSKDMFILTSDVRPIRSGQKKQVHARKFHSYFWVFEKGKK